MVTESVWAQAGLGAGFLCTECLEHRIGRELTGWDFTYCLANVPDDWDAPRLFELKQQAADAWLSIGLDPQLTVQLARL
jgi:hypothetical protein